MTDPDPPSSPTTDLRKRAEEKLRLAEAEKTAEPISPEEARRLLHELQVHQIELEMQNEELRHRQGELEASRSQYCALYDLAPVGYLTLNDQGLIRQANLTAAFLLGMAREALLKQPLTRFILPKDQDFYYLHRKKLLATRMPQSVALRLFSTERPFFWALLQAIPTENGECRITLSDITDRKQAEEALQKAHDALEQRVRERTLALEKTHAQLLQAEKLAAIGGLSASIAHEFNNPLQGVMNVLSGVKRRVSLGKEEAALVDMAVTECNRMSNLIKNLQDFNRPTSGKLALLDIHAAIDSLLLLSKNAFATSGITVTKNYAADLPRIKVVTDQIKQVFLNLLNNGADACEHGGTITIHTEADEKNIIVRIQDTGTGIPPENMEHIFEPFFSTKPAVKGTGLGLSISYGIIKAHGGEITVQSELGKGTIFSVILPIAGGHIDEEKHSAG